MSAASPPPFLNEPSPSPRWGSTTKLVVGLTIVGIIVALTITFRNIIGPLILAFILSYLLHPVAQRITLNTKLTWRMAVNLIYLLLLVLVISLITLLGFAVVNQLQSLVSVVENFIAQVPEIVANLSKQAYRLGPYTIDFAQFDLTALSNQLLASVQPLITRAGGLVTSLATGTVVTFGWGLFVMVISYFLLAETSQMSNEVVQINVPGYSADVRRLGAELRRIWNAFLRGQLIIIMLVVISYTLLMAILGVRSALGIAILAGLARFVPYVGPAVTWTVTFLVAFFQSSNNFGLPPLYFALLAIGLALLLDQIFDNLIGPRLMGTTLGVHPAGVLIAALVSYRLIGVIGLVLAAPVLATLKLLATYIIRKMFDQDPWSELDMVSQTAPPDFSLVQSLTRLRDWWREREASGIFKRPR